MDEKQYELVEIQVDAELLEQLEAVIAPMGLTPEMLAVKFFEFCVDPATQKLAISLLLKWKAEQEAEGDVYKRQTYEMLILLDVIKSLKASLKEHQGRYGKPDNFDFTV